MAASSTPSSGRPLTLNVVVAIGIGLALACVILFDFTASSPGAISAVHAGLPELGGPAGCAACHGAEGESLAAACSKCHADIGAQLTERRGIHGQLEPAKAAECGRCHAEHRGPEFHPAGDRAFAAAGFAGGLAEFKHQGLGFQLTGKHDQLECKTCHEHAADPVLAAGCKRFLGLHQDCASCHDDPHRGRLTDCAKCHGQVRPFDEAPLFKHDPRFALRDAHAELACKTCHAPDSTHALDAALLRSERGETVAVRTCGDCHESSHADLFLQAIGAIAKVTAADSCEHCHSTKHPNFYTPDASASRRLHACTGLALTPPHEQLDCRTCHEGIGTLPPAGIQAVAEHAKRFPGRDPSTCTSCHESSHTSAFLTAVARIQKTRPPQTCTLCHGGGKRDFCQIDTTANRQLHAATGFDLVPPHDRADCKACHDGIGSRTVAAPAQPRMEPAPRTVPRDPRRNGPTDAHAQRFPGRDAQNCSACHEDPHGQQFATGAFAGARCHDCHARLRFQPAAFTATHHAKTRFPLTGAHQAVGCQVCHKTDAKAPHPVYRDAPTQCADCHVDVHDGFFASARTPKSHRGATGCARCHDTKSFELAKGATFDHARWTGYPLIDSHAKAKCAQCHPATTPTHDRTRDFAKAATRCATCHADPHAGQFAFRGQTHCAQCHTPKSTFDAVTFNHNKDSRFQLDKHHAKLSCAKCHLAYDLKSGDPQKPAKVVRYKPLGTQCADCHGWKSTEDYERRRARGWVK